MIRWGVTTAWAGAALMMIAGCTLSAKREAGAAQSSEIPPEQTFQRPLTSFEAARRDLPVQGDMPSRIAGEFGELFAPTLDGADATVVLDVSRTGPPRLLSRTVWRKGDRARVEEAVAGSVTNRFIDLRRGVIRSITRNQNVGVEIVALRRVARSPAGYTDFTMRPTEATRVVAGERCRVWEVYRSPAGRKAGSGEFGHTRMSCVTDDGIDLRGWGDRSSEAAVARTVDRGRLDDRAVLPAPGVFDWRNWFARNAFRRSLRSPADFEVLFRDVQRGGQPMIIRRRDVWTYREESFGDQLTVTLSSPKLEQSLTIYLSNGGGGEWLQLARRYAPALEADPAASTEPVRLPTPWPDGQPDWPDEVVLGERCSWRDDSPDGLRGLEFECRASDGTPLIVSKVGRFPRRYVAVSVSRRPLPVSAILPPERYLSERYWSR